MYGKTFQMVDRFVAWIFHSCLQTLAAFAIICFCISAPALASKELGTWLNTDRKGKIQLRECGDNSLCSELVWLKDPLDEKGKPWRDILNPDTSKRKRHVVGLDVLIGTKKIGPNTWQGQIYDPEVGKTYYLKHLKVGKEKVEIKGCLSSGWPCRTKYWTRTKPVKSQAPAQIAKRKVAAPPAPAPAPVPRAARPRVAPPVAVAPPPAVSPPVQPQMPYPSQPSQARAPLPPAPATRPLPPDVTAALPRPAVNPARGGFLVQVAARQSHNEALQAYNELQRRFPRLLGDVPPQVLKADLGQRGIWYRVGVGPMTQQSAADTFCRKLKSLGADCLIRRH